MKNIYPDGDAKKEEEEAADLLAFAMEWRRRGKKQIKKMALSNPIIRFSAILTRRRAKSDS
jgi:predicted ATP-dependent Lon-type protease